MRASTPDRGRLDWEPDPLLMASACRGPVKDKGVLVFTACSHAGVVNVLRTRATVSGSAALGVRAVSTCPAALSASFRDGRRMSVFNLKIIRGRALHGCVQ